MAELARGKFRRLARLQRCFNRSSAAEALELFSLGARQLVLRGRNPIKMHRIGKYSSVRCEIGKGHHLPVSQVVAHC